MRIINWKRGEWTPRRIAFLVVGLLLLAHGFCGCDFAALSKGYAVDGGMADATFDLLQPQADSSPARDAGADLLPTVPDLAQCLAWVGGAPDQIACVPGTEQMSSGATCYKKICGCMNQSTCTGCFWSPWLQTACP